MWQQGKQNPPAQPVEGKQSFSLFLIRGLFATGNDRKLLDSKQTLMGEPSRSWHDKKKSL